MAALISIALLSMVLSLAAAGLIYYSWRQRGKALLAAAGWLLALASVFGWSRVLGAEIGTIYAIAIFTCLAWGAVAFNAEAPKAAAAGARPFQGLQRPQLRGMFHHSVLFLLSVPAAGVIAMMLSIALVLHLPWPLLDRAAVAIFVYPVLWGALGVWICAQEQLLKPVLASAGLLLLSSLVMYIRL